MLRDGLQEEDRERAETWLKAMNNLDDYIAFTKENEGGTLRERQFTVFEDIRAYFEEGGKGGYVQLPTGVGKTVLFVELAESMDVRTLVVVPTKELVKQTRDKFERFASGMEVGLHYSLRKDVGKKVTVTTYDSFVAGVKSGAFLPDQYDLLVLDEVHEALTEARKSAVRSFDDVLTVGFSATPAYSEAKSTEKLLDKEIHSMKLTEAIHDGLLCGVSIIMAQTNIDLSNIKVSSTGEYSEKDFEKALNIEVLTRSCVELYQKAFSGERGLAYCAGVTHAKDVAKAFRDAGISAEAVYGDMDDTERENIIERYRRGEISILTNDKVLTVGFDVPEASVCFNLAPTSSPVRAPQRGGRVLRLDENRPEKVASVIEFVHKDNRRHRWVLLSSILNGSLVLPAGYEERFPAIQESRRKALQGMTIEGLHIEIDTEEIMRITREHERKLEREKISWGDFVAAVRKAGIQSNTQFHAVSKEHPDWPSAPDRHYPEWRSWPELFGREVIKHLAWSDFLEDVKKAGITSVPQYKVAKKQHKNWPSQPERVYSDWKSWNALFGREVVEKLPYDEFKAAVKAAGVGSYDEYFRAKESHPKWPAEPAKYYGEWKSWPELFGKPEKPSWDDFVASIKQTGVQSVAQYKARRATDHPEWPASPDRSYKDQWKSWPDLFGKSS